MHREGVLCSTRLCPKRPSKRPTKRPTMRPTATTADSEQVLNTRVTTQQTTGNQHRTAELVRPWTLETRSGGICVSSWIITPLLPRTHPPSRPTNRFLGGSMNSFSLLPWRIVIGWGEWGRGRWGVGVGVDWVGGGVSWVDGWVYGWVVGLLESSWKAGRLGDAVAGQGRTVTSRGRTTAANTLCGTHCRSAWQYVWRLSVRKARWRRG